MQQSQAYNKTWRSISGSVTDYAFALAESTLTNHFQYTKMRSRYQIRALTVQGTKKIWAGAPLEHKQIGTKKITWCLLNGRVTRYFRQATRILKSAPCDTCIGDYWVLMNLWKYHIVVQVPQKLGARGAVQPTRATSIEVFVDEECAQYVIDILAYTSAF